MLTGGGYSERGLEDRGRRQVETVLGTGVLIGAVVQIGLTGGTRESRHTITTVAVVTSGNANSVIQTRITCNVGKLVTHKLYIILLMVAYF